jgi:hypothetical protein
MSIKGDYSMPKPIRTALYYPHTTVDDEELLKSALLTWDKLEFIVPSEKFSPSYRNKNAARAMELIGKKRLPTDAEKEETHRRIEDLVKEELPSVFYFSDQTGRYRSEIYEVYPQKFHKSTWELLHEKQMRGDLLENADYPLSEPAGLMIMSILADCCAGKTRVRVTDRGEAYASLASLGTTFASAGDAAHEDRLIAISLNILDLSAIPLGEMIEMREREEKGGGSSLRDLRHRYIDSLQTYVERLRNEVCNKADAEEALRQFRDDLEIDLKNLKKELGFASREALFSKEMLVTTVAAAGTVGTWVLGLPVALSGVISAAGGPATVGGFAAIHNRFQSARHTIMQRHPMAYLYQQSRHARWGPGPPWTRFR